MRYAAVLALLAALTLAPATACSQRLIVVPSAVSPAVSFRQPAIIQPDAVWRAEAAGRAHRKPFVIVGSILGGVTLGYMAYRDARMKGLGGLAVMPGAVLIATSVGLLGGALAGFGVSFIFYPPGS